MRNALMLPLISSAVIVLTTIPVAAICNPVDFMAKDSTKIIWTDDLKTAFLLTASKEQYEQASKGGATSFGYGGFTGSLDFNQARQSAFKELELQNMTFSHEQYLNLISQRLSPDASIMYSKCLESLQSPGLRIWLEKKEGNFIILNATWVGGDETKGLGEYDKEPVVREAEIVEKPDTWPKGKRQQIVLKKASDADAYLSISVSGQKYTYIALRDHRPTQMGSRIVSGEPAQVDSGGTTDGNHPACQPDAQKSCAVPKHPRGYLVVGSGTAIQTKLTGDRNRVGWRVVDDKPEQICIEFYSSTGACPHLTSSSGRASAIERYPLE
jgi:hypothetical protein